MLLGHIWHDNYGKLNKFINDISEGRWELFKALISEGQLIARIVLQGSLDVAVTVARKTATAIMMCRTSLLQSSGFPKDLQSKMEDLPFDREKLFSTKADEILHFMKDSWAILHTLGIYTPATKWR